MMNRIQMMNTSQKERVSRGGFGVVRRIETEDNKERREIIIWEITNRTVDHKVNRQNSSKAPHLVYRFYSDSRRVHRNNFNERFGGKMLVFLVFIFWGCSRRYYLIRCQMKMEDPKHLLRRCDLRPIYDSSNISC